VRTLKITAVLHAEVLRAAVIGFVRFAKEFVMASLLTRIIRFFSLIQLIVVALLLVLLSIIITVLMTVFGGGTPVTEESVQNPAVVAKVFNPPPADPYTIKIPNPLSLTSTTRATVSEDRAPEYKLFDLGDVEFEAGTVFDLTKYIISKEYLVRMAEQDKKFSGPKYNSNEKARCKDYFTPVGRFRVVSCIGRATINPESHEEGAGGSTHEILQLPNGSWIYCLPGLHGPNEFLVRVRNILIMSEAIYIVTDDKIFKWLNDGNKIENVVSLKSHWVFFDGPYYMALGGDHHDDGYTEENREGFIFVRSVGGFNPVIGMLTRVKGFSFGRNWIHWRYEPVAK
jgi:hypothetical protein